MKAVVVLLASSFAAVSSMAFASAYAPVPYSYEVSSPAASAVGAGRENEQRSGYEKFVPRFDGLRFIETLVTAHR